MKNPDYSAGERHEMISGVVLSIAQFSDENELFVNEELSVHCSTVFMGAEEVYGIEDVAKREKRKTEILESYVLARKMIREHSGVAEVDKFFANLAKPKLTKYGFIPYRQVGVVWRGRHFLVTTLEPSFVIPLHGGGC